MSRDPFPFGFPLAEHAGLGVHRRGLKGRTPVAVLVYGEFHAKVMLPDGSTLVVRRDEVWIEGVDGDLP